MRAPLRALPLLLALGAGSISACTTEARVGYWSTSGTASLSNDDAAVLEPNAPYAGSMAVDPIAMPEGEAPRDSSSPDGRNLSPLCLRNPSLDGIPYAGALAPDTWWPAEAWEACWYAPEDYPPELPETGLRISAVTIVNDATTIDAKDGSMPVAGALPAPTHGFGYLHFDTLLGLPERTSQTMCAELEAGVTYNFAIDLASRAGQSYDGKVIGPGSLEIYGTNTICGHEGEPLWTSPLLGASWQTYCVSITAPADVTIMTLQVSAEPRSRTAIIVDNLRLDPSCGPAVVRPNP